MGDRIQGIGSCRPLGRGHAVAPTPTFLTTFDLDEYVYAGMRAGASGFLLKDTPAKELAAAVRSSLKATRCWPKL